MAIDLPPLRDRGEDTLVLAYHFLRRLGGPTPPRLDPALERLWLTHAWEGNVRELRNEIEYLLMVHAGQAVLRPDHSRVGSAPAMPDRSATRPGLAVASTTVIELSPCDEELLMGTAADRRQASIEELARRHPRIIRKNVVDRLGCAPRTAASDLHALVEAGILLVDHDRAGRAVAYRHVARPARER